MLKIATCQDTAGAVTLSLSGNVNEDSLSELAQAVETARGQHEHVRIDLSEVTLVDRHSLKFLVAQRERDVDLVNCPAYIEPWIFRENG